MVNWEVIVVRRDLCLFPELLHVAAKELMIDPCLAAVVSLRVLIGQLYKMINVAFVC